MRFLFRRRFLLAVAAAMCLGPAGTASQVDSGYGSLPVFELHSGFWINLHHTIYHEAREKRDATSAPDAGKAATPGRPVLQVAPAASSGLNAEEQRAWDAAVSYYVANYAGKDLLFSTEMALIKNQLGDFETCDELSGKKNKFCNAGLPANLTRILEGAAGVYRAHRWAVDDRANRAWIKRVAPLVREQGVGLSHRLADVYEAHWPAEKIRVDVARFANATGAYTTLEPLRVTIASGDSRNQGTEALEVLFHEASHGIAEGVEEAIARECRQRDKAIPRDLWHALIFYTTGEVIRPVMEGHAESARPGDATGSGGHGEGDERYTPYAQREGLYRRGWQQYFELLKRYWQPYLEGQVTFDNAIAHMVSAL